MQSRVSPAMVWCCDDLAPKVGDAPDNEHRIVIDLATSAGSGVATLLMTQAAAEALYAVLWAALADEANAGVGLCDLADVARIGESDDGQQLVCG